MGVAGLGGDVKSALSPSRPFVQNSATSPPGLGDPRQLVGMKTLWNLPCLWSLFCFEEFLLLIFVAGKDLDSQVI